MSDSIAGATRGAQDSVALAPVGSRSVPAGTRLEPAHARLEPDRGRLDRASEHAWATLPALFVLYLGFDAGGYFAGTTGVAAAAAALLLGVRVATAERPLARLSRSAVVALAGGVSYATLSLLSEAWSHSPSRALLAFDRGTLYAALVAIFVIDPARGRRSRTMVRTLTCSLSVVCLAGLLTRTLPHVFPVSAGFQNQRLSYPVTYWNALGMVAMLAILSCIHLSSDPSERRSVKILAAALVPALVATLLLTFSRGAIAALLVGIAVYIVFGPRRGFLAAALAISPAVAFAARETLDARLLATARPTVPAAVTQGQHLALVLAGCMVAAAALRAVFVGLGSSSAVHAAAARAGRLTARARPSSLGAAVATAPRRVAVWALICSLAVTVAIAAGLGTSATHEYRAFVDGNVVPSTGPAVDRLTSAGNNGRLQLWKVALDGFDADPLRGAGAGTFPLLWERRRSIPLSVQNAHSLYLETLAELGVVGFVALAAFLLALLAGAVVRARAPDRRDRAVGALSLAVFVAWALHCAVDWDWQMPGVTVAPLALAATVNRRPAGAALARAHAGVTRRGRYLLRACVAVCCALIGLPAAFVAVSQADLDLAVRALERRDCKAAMAAARGAHAAAGIRPEPLEIIGYCQADDGSPRAAERTMRQAIALDPGDWEFRYALAVVTARAGGNPRPALRAAHRLNPLEPLITAASDAFAGKRGRALRRTAATVQLDVP